jgi:hypothetical protein
MTMFRFFCARHMELQCAHLCGSGQACLSGSGQFRPQQWANLPGTPLAMTIVMHRQAPSGLAEGEKLIDSSYAVLGKAERLQLSN